MVNSTCCIILAAGEGKRMKLNGPKVLSSVLFEPMIGWVINSVVRCDIHNICVVTGYKHELVKDYMDGLGYNLESVVQQERKGTAHAVLTASAFLEKHRGGDILILGGDSPFIDHETIKRAYKVHQNANNAATIISSRLHDPCGYGRIVRNRSDYSVEAIVEEADATFNQRSITEINSGAYWFKVDDLLSYLGKISNNNVQHEYYITSVIKFLIDDGLRVDAFESMMPDVVLGVNNLNQLQKLNEIARNKVLDSLMSSGVKIACRDGIIIGKWVQIGADTAILPGTILSGKTVIGNGCTIGPNSQIIDCVVGDSAVVNSSYCKDSVIPNDKNVGPFENIVNTKILI